MDRPTHQDGIRIDVEFCEWRDRMINDRIARRNLKDIVNRVRGTKIGPQLQRLWAEEQRARTPDANDKNTARKLKEQGDSNYSIGIALDLSVERVIEALA